MPVGSVDLVARECIEVAIERLHIDRGVRHGLSAVEQHRHAARVRQPHDLLHRQHGAERVGDVRNRDQARALAEQRLEAFEIQFAVGAVTGAARSRAPVAAHTICHGTMLA